MLKKSVSSMTVIVLMCPLPSAGPGQAHAAARNRSWSRVLGWAELSGVR